MRRRQAAGQGVHKEAHAPFSPLCFCLSPHVGGRTSEGGEAGARAHRGVKGGPPLSDGEHQVPTLKSGSKKTAWGVNFVWQFLSKKKRGKKKWRLFDSPPPRWAPPHGYFRATCFIYYLYVVMYFPSGPDYPMFYIIFFYF